jgi:hypothetical protein
MELFRVLAPPLIRQESTCMIMMAAVLRLFTSSQADITGAKVGYQFP